MTHDELVDATALGDVSKTYLSWNAKGIVVASTPPLGGSIGARPAPFRFGDIVRRTADGREFIYVASRGSLAILSGPDGSKTSGWDHLIERVGG